MHNVQVRFFITILYIFLQLLLFASNRSAQTFLRVV